MGTVLGGTIKSCRNAGGVASATAGGIAGSIQYESTVEQCVSTGPVSGILYGSGSIAGGIAGIMEASAVKNCYSTGPVQVNNKETTYAGGIAGKMSGGSLSSCYATGKIEGGVHEAFDPFNIGYAGGIVGYLEQNRNGAKGEIKNVAALNASVTGDARGAVGNHDKDFTGSQLHAWDGLKDSQGDSAIPVDGWTVKERVWEQGYWSADIGLDFDTVWQKVIQQNAVEVLLPLLRDVSDQNGRLPDHLKRFIRDPLTVELKLKASETHLLYTGNSRSVFFEATVEGVLSDRRLIWSHDADKKVEVRQLSQTEYYASFPDDYQGTMKMTGSL